ncbi:Calx-beta domain-containing protein [Paractinoplanes durhamensis]|uniref:Calx-beta domain-containing protein n=1 Tax=Paractinoplanes durhamensis TaxID=113563 RepID=A0ABQ3YXC8_9ACTN|nr:Calx-beta domain-containing protein [Actinoplanes durhamensis]GIE02225.1 hypothetical protein Adu01nite_35750 [Actinoplanes durhamensis]
MRYSEAHAAKSGSVPFALRGPKSVRMALAAAVAGAVGLVPAVAVTTPAYAALTDVTITPATGSVTEGGELVYNVKNANMSDAVNLKVEVVPDPDSMSTAVDKNDYTLSATTLSVPKNSTKQVTLRAVDDAWYEPTETFLLKVTDTAAMDPTDPDSYTTAKGKIYDNDNKPSYTLTVAPSTVSEKSTMGADVTAKVTVTLSAKSGVDTKVKIGTQDGTAKAPGDYTAIDPTDPDNTLTIMAGQLSASTSVTVISDGVQDTMPTEMFKVTASADNASPSDQAAVVSIVDAQSAPTLTLTQAPSGGTQDEAKDITYTVHASSMSESPITARWDVVPVKPAEGDDPAMPGQDFVYPSSRTVTIPAGEDSATFTISLSDDGLNENSEDFGVQLVAPVGAILDEKNSWVTSTIKDINLEDTPRVKISPASVPEGNTGKSAKTFTATLSQKSGRKVTVDWKTIIQEMGTMDPPATPGKDYITKKGTLVFPAGTLTQTFTVEIVGDTTNEGPEVFWLALASDDKSADFTTDTDDAMVPITIDDDDLPPMVMFDGVTMKEGEATVPVMLQVKLSNPSTHDIHFDVAGDSASGPGFASGMFDPDIPGSGDYTLLASGDKAVTIRAGQTVGYVPLLVNGDTMFEPDETADITATIDADDADFVSPATQSKTATIKLLNDDKAPTLWINDVDAMEGDSVDVTGTVDGTADSDMNFNISFAGASYKGSKAADTKDFTNPGVLTATIPAGTEPGDSVSIGSVNIIDDPEPEGAETIGVSGMPQQGSWGKVETGWITIAPSDGGQNVKPTLTLAANVTGGINTPITGKAGPGATVELWGGPISAKEGPLTKLAWTMADKSGWYKFTRTLGQGYRFKVASAGEMSEEKWVTVTQDPVFVASSSAKGMVSFAVQGTPRGVGQTVIVQNWVGGKWVNAWKGTTGSDNVWKATAKVASGSAISVRAFVQGFTPNGIMGGYSATKRITIK